MSDPSSVEIPGAGSATLGSVKAKLSARFTAWTQNNAPNYWFAMSFGASLAVVVVAILWARAIPDGMGSVGLIFAGLLLGNGLIAFRGVRVQVMGLFKNAVQAMRGSGANAAGIPLAAVFGWVLGLNALNVAGEFAKHGETMGSMIRLGNIVTYTQGSGGDSYTLDVSEPSLWTDAQKALYGVRGRGEDAVATVNLDAMSRWCASTQGYAERNLEFLKSLGRTQGGGMDVFGQKSLYDLMARNGCISGFDHMAKTSELSTFALQNQGVFYTTWKPLGGFIYYPSPSLSVGDAIGERIMTRQALLQRERYCALIGAGLATRSGLALGAGGAAGVEEACQPLIAERNAMLGKQGSDGVVSASDIAWFEARLPAALGLK